MKNITTEPEVGQIFGIWANQLSTVELLRTYDLIGKSFVRRAFGDCRNDEKILKDRVLMLKYLGNGLCQEYYTSKYVRLVFSDTDFNEFLSSDGQWEPSIFMKQFSDFLASPLIINGFYVGADFVLGYEIDYDFKQSFADNIGYEEKIVEAIEKIEKKAVINLKCALLDIAAQDHGFAYAENAMYNLENGIKVKTIGEKKILEEQKV